ncbi:MAG: A24 family peptidase [Isosphaeraceae bacterium]
MAQVPREVVWLLSVILIEAAVIDGLKLRVPNWLTFHLVVGGLGFSSWYGGVPGLVASLEGATLGLVLMLPLYLIGGMGAGDVKLFAGVGAWVGPSITLGAFVTAVEVGGVMALVMIAWSGRWAHHWAMFQTIVNEVLTIRSPGKLSTIAAARKPSMTLLPYGIPLTVGSIAYFAWAGLLV